MKLFTTATLVLLFSFLGFSVKSNPGFRFDGDTLALPFEEDFTSGIFETNGWEVEGTNWQIAGQMGHPAPAVKFHYAPVLENYDVSLISPLLNGNSVTDCRIYLDFDIKFDDNTATGNEKLFVEIFSDTSWNEVAQLSSNGDFDWTSKKINITTHSRSKLFKIRFRAVGINTLDINSWLIDNINVHMVCEPPINLYYSEEDPFHYNEITLSWDAPGYVEPPVWKHWDNGINNSGVGLNDSGTFYVAIRFTPAQLIQLGLPSICVQKIKFFPYSTGGPLVLKIWQGSGYPQLVYSQPVNTYIPGEWNLFDLDTLKSIDRTQELWIGYQVTNDDGQWTAGVDSGPAVAGFGDMISTDGVTWDQLSGYDMNYNWNLQAYIGPVPPEDTCITIGYNIYRDEEFLATTIETSYLDILPEYTFHCYEVTALYNDGESDDSNESCLWIDVDKIDINSVTLNPNPATDIVNIQLVPGISKIEITDLKGSFVSTYSINPLSNQFPINVSDYTPGIYLMRFSGNKVILEKKLVIQ